MFNKFNNITPFFIKAYYFSLLLFLFFVRLICQKTPKKNFLSEGKSFFILWNVCVPFPLFWGEKLQKFCLPSMLFMCYYVYYFGKNLQIIIFIMFWLLKTVICTVHFFVIFRRLVRKFVIKMWYIYVQNEAILWYKNFLYQKFSIGCLLNNKTLLFTYDSYYFICVIYLFYALQHFDEKS